MSDKPFYQRNERERKDVEGPAIEYAQKRGWWHTKIVSPSKNKLPDDLFVRAGVYLWIEFKAPGEEPNRGQLARHQTMRDRGMDVRWTNSLTQAKEWLK